MENQRNGPVKGKELDEELADVLTAIGVVAKRLASRIREMCKGEDSDGNKNRDR